VNRDVGALTRTLVALALFAFVTVQTMGALRASGAWSGPGRMLATAPDDPVAGIERLLAVEQPASVTPARDPFMLGAATAPLTHATPHIPRKPAVPPPPPQPVLTAIVWDADPRALVHWKNRDWTVRAGGLFDEFQVTSITRDQVVLSRGSETIVLQRRTQGD